MLDAQKQIDTRAIEIAAAARNDVVHAMNELKRHEEYCTRREQEYKQDRKEMMGEIKESFRGVHTRINTASYLLIVTLLGMVGALFWKAQGWS